jgi:hypothetical protein
MNCPVCNQPMTPYKKDTCVDSSKNNKMYDRTYYKCVKDDVWTHSEIPQKEQQPAITGS